MCGQEAALVGGRRPIAINGQLEGAWAGSFPLPLLRGDDQGGPKWIGPLGARVDRLCHPRTHKLIVPPVGLEFEPSRASSARLVQTR